MKIRPFFEALNTSVPAAALIRDEDRDIFSFRPAVMSESMKDNILYTGMPAQFLNRDIESQVNLILLAGPNDPDSVTIGQKNPEANILFVSGITQAQLFGIISDIFMEENQVALQREEAGEGQTKSASVCISSCIGEYI